ncbi:MAG: aminopeptidase N [Pseudomonadota bacterium]
MKDGAPQEIRLSDYQPPGYVTTDVHLDFDIHEGLTTVTSTLKVLRQDNQASSLCLDGQELKLISVEVDGELLSDNEFQVDDESLTIHGLSDQHQIRIVTEIVPEKNTALEGLYRSSQMYCTQCEAEGFRKITYYQDRPDVLARFTTSISADQQSYPDLLSNGNCIDTKSLPNGRHQATWEDPFPKPSYLFALVAGNLARLDDTFTTMSGREVVLQIFSEPHNIDQCHYAMDVLKRSMAWDEQRFGREYDLDIFMIVAVEDFNMGAMENKGLNIFNTSCVLASPDTATDLAYQRVEAVVAHEYFHNWSGNRVTCRDWFQLSLKEGFTVFRDAEFSSDMNSRAVKRIEDVAFLRSVQFAEDGGPLAHPVRPQSYLEISNFYTVTIYEKGAEVVRMYQTLLGEEAFRAGSDLYFDRHDGQAVTTDHFAAAMESVSGRDLTQFKRWYEQAGTPGLTVSQSYSGDTLILDIGQSCPATPGQENKAPFHIPILLGLLDAEGIAIPVAGLRLPDDDAVTPIGESTLLVEITDSQCQIEIGGLTNEPIVSFLREFSAPVKVEFPRKSQDLVLLAQHDEDGFVAWDALQTLWLGLFEDLDADPTEVVSLVGELVRKALGVVNDPQQALLAATMLSIPEENYLLELLQGFDVLTVLDRRDELHALVASRHFDLWQTLYDATATAVAFKPDAHGISRRSLNNIALGYLADALEGDGLDDLVRSHFTKADNLTTRRAALAQACRNPQLSEALREEIVQEFYRAWQHEALVLDQWFNLQASSPLSRVEDLQALEAHEKFDLKNPNRARSIFGAFGMLNNRVLHAEDGSGYTYLAQAVAKMDDLNPQIAARLAVPLTRWHRYDVKRQNQIKACLEQLVNAQGISKDLYEIVSKSLA